MRQRRAGVKSYKHRLIEEYDNKPLLKFDCYAERVVLDCRGTRRLTTDGELTEEVDASVTRSTM